MNRETEVKLQALFDNEIDSIEARQLTKMLDTDPAARALYEELRLTRKLLDAGGEMDVEVPASRAFYWSRIERSIAPEYLGERTLRTGLNGFWLRLRIPAVAAAAVVLLYALWPQISDESETTADYFHEIEAPPTEEHAITFHSEAAAMTIVWIDANGADPHVFW